MECIPDPARDFFGRLLGYDIGNVQKGFHTIKMDDGKSHPQRLFNTHTRVGNSKLDL
jgi:hypothetical protein